MSDVDEFRALLRGWPVLLVAVILGAGAALWADANGLDNLAAALLSAAMVCLGVWLERGRHGDPRA